MSQSTQQTKRNPSNPHLLKWGHILAGGAAGAVGAVITCPLEVVKTRLQSRAMAGVSVVSESTHKNVLDWTWQAMKGIVQREGIGGLWRGLGPTLVGVVPSRALYFSVYTSTKSHLLPFLENHNRSSAADSLVHFASAMNAGVVSTTITSPLWMVKTRLQLATERTAQTLSDTRASSIPLAIALVRQEGFLSLWKGLSASYLGVFETCLQWVIYEKMKHTAAQHYLGDPARSEDLHPLSLFGFASVSKLIASVSWYPHEVVRTRLREANAPYTGLFNCLSTIARTEGIRKLYAGLAVHLMRVVPNSAITFMTFEVISRSFNPIKVPSDDE